MYLTPFLTFRVVLSTIRGQGGKKRRKNHGEHRGNPRAHGIVVHYPEDIFISQGQSSSSNQRWREKRATYIETITQPQDYNDFTRSQDKEDIWLYENYFYGQSGGIVIESGALDGSFLSNSWFFEKYLNWTCIHVEADPTNFRNLVINRPNAVNINGALCSEPKLLHYTNDGSKAVNGFIEFMPESFIKTWHPKIYNNITKIENLQTVTCVRMDLLLSELNVNHVDLWILDVEGAEESVLLGTNFKDVRINSILMECGAHHKTKNERMMTMLEKEYEYICGTVERNCFCRHKDMVVTEFKSSAKTIPAVLQRHMIQ